MSDNANATDKKEDPNITEKAINKTPSITEVPADWQKQMWETYNDDYSKRLSQHCYDQTFAVKINKAEAKNPEQLLFTEPQWTDARLILKNMSTAQTDHVDTQKTDWIQSVRNSAMTPEDYEKNKIPMPKNYTQLNIERKRQEKQYYEEATRIMFKLKVGDEQAREISIEDYGRLERTNLKFAVDCVHLSLAKPEPKNEDQSSSLYT